MSRSHSDTVVMLVTPHLEPNLHVTEIQLIKIYKHNYDLTDPGITRYNDNNRISISIQMTISIMHMNGSFAKPLIKIMY